MTRPADLEAGALREGRYTVVYEGSPAGFQILSGEPAVGRAITVALGDLHDEAATLRKSLAEQTRLRKQAEREIERLSYTDDRGAVWKPVPAWSYFKLHREREALTGEIEQLRADRNALAAFARDLFDETDDRDVLELQELGIEHGLLHEVAFDPEKHVVDETDVVLDAGDPFIELTDLCAPIGGALIAQTEAGRVEG